ncbi:hypothetical protein [Cetobacterium sp.]|uniref:hypothetical protein n=1 Tax=Cetobacterium sp. TaxID=2071632 RepID=UPI003F40A7DE
MHNLDFKNFEKYKGALDDGFTWGNANLRNPTTAMTIQKSEKGEYTLGSVNFRTRESKIFVKEKDFKIFTKKVQQFFLKSIN